MSGADGRPTRSLVTGAAGFVGSHLVDALAARGDTVRASDLPERGPRDDLPYSPADLTDPAAVRTLVADVDVVFHVASLVHTRRDRRRQLFAVNHGGTLHLLDACRRAGVRRLVYVSSASVVYEGHDIENGDESLPYGRSHAPYTESKIAAEREVLRANGRLRTCAVRPHVVFGPGDGRFLPAILERARAGRLRRRIGRGTALSDFTYVANVVDALLLADRALADGRAGGEAYFVTNGEPMAFWEFVDRVLVAVGQPPSRGSIPYPIAYAAAAVAELWSSLRDGDSDPESGLSRFAVRYLCTHHYFDIGKARRELGYAPRIDLDEGIRHTLRAL